MNEAEAREIAELLVSKKGVQGLIFSKAIPKEADGKRYWMISFRRSVVMSPSMLFVRVDPETGYGEIFRSP